ncbi:hypothetical protein DYP60_09505 [Sphaerochaeta halotolerans]|uniref:Uncharacterized protein n=1 Tax=Sphaerochaeta halotolerans TaxID=2293840 RepID=A0A372MGK5_9SPIR|nr:hypothetical protein DYP60_09505 [Sphaerochaeta halotolerans]
MPPFPPQGTGYLTLLSRHSLQRGTIMLIPFLSLRWGMKDVIVFAQLTLRAEFLEQETIGEQTISGQWALKKQH